MDVERVEELKRLSSAYPADGTLYYELGQLYCKSRQYMDAIYLFTAAITVEPDYAEAYLALGDAYAAEGHTFGARQIYEEGMTVASRARSSLHLLQTFQERVTALANA
ncbi:MAG: tetratricopeptide repeat protein [Candidatus Tectomicrobia bacterium]|nr:tetratricopeptide repeat protein [Candidatus Tectomicrobia bacterium]